MSQGLGHRVVAASESSPAVRVAVLLLVAYAGSRVMSWLALLAVYTAAAREGVPIAQFDRRPDFLGFLQSWDGLNYREIALSGYPGELPRNPDGRVEKNLWAFLPLYPIVVRCVMEATGVGFGVAAVATSVVAGAFAALLLHRILLSRVTPTAAALGALLFCFWPLSFLLQVAYAESLFLALMFASVLAMTARRFLVMIPFGVAAAFAHPGALALAAAIGVRTVIRLIRREPVRRRELISAVAAAALIGAAGFSWPIIVSARTGTPDAYFLTELAWWRTHIGEVGFVPFTPWFLMAWRYSGWIGLVAVALAVASAAWLLVSGRSRELGTDVLVYLGSYLAYLFAVFLPQQSVFRMLLPLAPALGTPALSRTAVRRWSVLIACVPLQLGAILLLWVHQPP